MLLRTEEAGIEVPGLEMELKPLEKEEKTVDLENLSYEFLNMGPTWREVEIAGLLLKRFSNHEIGEMLCISETLLKTCYKYF